MRRASVQAIAVGSRKLSSADTHREPRLSGDIPERWPSPSSSTQTGATLRCIGSGGNQVELEAPSACGGASLVCSSCAGRYAKPARRAASAVAPACGESEVVRPPLRMRLAGLLGGFL
jgi:predicted RNA-binding Zn-ribbon protein involved in translation (DUF1610 family)